MTGLIRLHRDSERGATLIIATIMIVVLMSIGALVVDLGALRGNVRVDQNVADFAALAAGTARPALAFQGR